MALSLFTLGGWQVDAAANQIVREDERRELEPQVMDLLALFASRPGEVISKAEIISAIWGEVTVNDDALTRTLWKLRRGLGDDARAPRYIETVPKRGYRLIADVTLPETIPLKADAAAPPSRPPLDLLALGVLLVGATVALFIGVLTRSGPSTQDAGDAAVLLQRADAFYAQYTRTENEAALRLYETVLGSEPENAAALAGLSNAIAQRPVRWDGPDGATANRTSLTEALEAGWLDEETARAALARSEALARQAIEIDPGHARAWRALGLALSAQRDFVGAEAAYNRALVIQPDDWGSLINLSEVARLIGEDERSLSYLEQAYDAMSRRFAEDAVLIQPWQSQVGLSVAARKLETSELTEAELWYRRVLSADPLNHEAVNGLAALLREAGDAQGAEALCEDLLRRTGKGCQP